MSTVTYTPMHMNTHNTQQAHLVSMHIHTSTHKHTYAHTYMLMNTIVHPIDIIMHDTQQTHIACPYT